ncbi:MAG: hypothetical protein ACXU7D_00025 [Burkholderiaceae bacterium]
MTQDNFMSFKRHKYLKWALGLVLLCITLYATDNPPIKPGGGTWLGYGLGTLGAVLILWLLTLGIRKRAYGSNLGTVRGWLSAHVYLGIALGVIVTLHAGFEFGRNIHTLSYVLTMAVIFSGFYGVILYLRLPAQMGNLLDGRTLEQFGQSVREIDEQCRALSTHLSPTIQSLVAESANGAIFSTPWQRFTGKNSHCATKRVLSELGQNSDQTPKELHEIYTLQFRRLQLLNRIRDFIQLKTKTELWLLFHVPLSFGLLMALIAHIVSVFFYW